jgi:hypothetical protein
MKRVFDNPPIFDSIFEEYLNQIFPLRRANWRYGKTAFFCRCGRALKIQAYSDETGKWRGLRVFRPHQDSTNEWC